MIPARLHANDLSTSWEMLYKGFPYSNGLNQYSPDGLEGLNIFLIGRTWWECYIKGGPLEKYSARISRQRETNQREYVKTKSLEIGAYVRLKTQQALSCTDANEREALLIELMAPYCQLEDIGIPLSCVAMPSEPDFIKAYYSLFWDEKSDKTWHRFKSAFIKYYDWKILISQVPSFYVDNALVLLKSERGKVDGSGAEYYIASNEMLSYRANEAHQGCRLNKVPKDWLR
jgi:hypothetical protein